MSDGKDELIEALRACVDTFKALAEDRKRRIDWLECELERMRGKPVSSREFADMLVSFGLLKPRPPGVDQK